MICFPLRRWRRRRQEQSGTNPILSLSLISVLPFDFPFTFPRNRYSNLFSFQLCVLFVCILQSITSQSPDKTMYQRYNIKYEWPRAGDKCARNQCNRKLQFFILPNEFWFIVHSRPTVLYGQLMTLLQSKMLFDRLRCS